MVIRRGGGSWREKVTWGVHVGVGRSVRVRGCSSEFTETRASVLFGEISREGGREKITVSRGGKSEGRENRWIGDG